MLNVEDIFEKLDLSHVCTVPLLYYVEC